MTHYAICKLKNGEYECYRVARITAADKYKMIIDKAIQQIIEENSARKEQVKIVQFIELVEHGNGYTPHDHLVWEKEMCKQAQNCTYPVFDFERPENGVEYY